MRATITILTALALAGCGGSGDVSGNDSTAVAGSADTPAAELDCSGAKPQAAPAGRPADDVLGLRGGMSLADAKLLLKCTNKAFRFDEGRDGFRLPEMPDGSFAVTRLTATRGEISGCNPADPTTLKTCLADDPSFTRIDETVTVHLAGLPGREKVIAVARELHYPEGQEAAGETIGKDLAAKYGAGPLLLPGYGSGTRMAWVFDGEGRPMSAANPDLADCATAVGTGDSSPSQLRNGCRLTINGWAEGKASDGRLIERFGVVAVDQQAALDAIAAARTAIEAARGQAQQLEVERAKQRSGNTKL